MAQQNSNTGSITIRELASAFNSENHLEYRQLIDSAHLPTKMRQFLLRKQYYIRFQEDCAQFRENQLAVMENTLSEQTAEVEASLNALEVSEKEVESARKALVEAQHAFRLAQNKLNEQQATYDQALATHQQNQDRFNRGSVKQEDQERLIPDNARSLFDSNEEFESAIAYVELVLKFFFEGGQYELLYNSDGIDKLLNSIM